MVFILEVGSWGELKAAVEDSQNAGKVIVLTGNIQADKNNPIDTIAGSGIIIDGGGFTITGQEGTSDGQFINFGSEDKTDLIIQNVKLEGFGNVKTASYAYGGAIYNYGAIGNISGDFSGNYAQGSSYAEGGAIFNRSTIGDINGDFSDNYAQGSSFAYGGAIYNDEGTIGDITGDFIDNYAQSDSGSASGGAIYNFDTIGDITGDFSGNYAQGSFYAQGGAIYNYYGAIGDISGIFTGNYVKSDSSYARGGAIYNGGTMILTNSSFYDNYVQTGAMRDSNEGQMTFGGAIYNYGDLTIRADNGNSIFRGNKVIWGDSEDSSAIYFAGNLKLDSINNGLIQFDDKVSGAEVKQTMSKKEVDDFIKVIESIGIEIKQDGENYFVSGTLEGVAATYQFIKQPDGTYIMTAISGEMTITGDSRSKVVFNNAIEKVAKIDISGTNVDVNEGAGTIYRTVTHDGGVLNINSGAKAEDSIINSGGTLNVADKAEKLKHV